MATSTISNVLTDPSGIGVDGATVTATLMPGTGFRIADSSEVARRASTTTNGSGIWTLDLERNANITPADSWWEISEAIPEASGGARVWAISVGASNATLLASLVTPSQNPALANYLTQEAADARYQAIGAGTSDLAFINVLDYGADPTGISSSTTAIANASNAASGGICYFPPGTYLCGPNQFTTLANVTWEGAAKGASTIRFSGSASATNQGIFTLYGNQSGYHTFRNLSFDGVSRTPFAAKNAIFGLRASQITIEDCEFVDWADDAVKLRNCAKTYVRRNIVARCNNNGFEFSFVTADGYVGAASIPTYFECVAEDNEISVVDNNGAIGEGQGIYFEFDGIASNVRTVRIANNTVSDCVRGIHMEGNTAAKLIEELICTGNIVLRPSDSGIGLVQARRCTVTSNEVYNPGTAAAIALGATAQAMGMTGAYGDTVTFADNVLIDDRDSATDYATFGLRLAGSISNLVVTGNAIRCGSSANVWMQAVTGQSSIGLNGFNSVTTPAGSVGILFNGSSNTPPKGLDTNSYSGFTAANRFAGRPNAAVIMDRLVASATVDPPDLASGASQVFGPITVSGAVVGDSVACGFSNSLAGTSMVGYVSAANAVSVTHSNLTGGNVNLASGTLTVTVWNH